MQILLINNTGGGYADRIEVPDGISVGGLFSKQVPEGNPVNYLIRVNRQPATAEQILQTGDRVSITPLKIDAA